MLRLRSNERYTDPALVCRYELAGKRCGQAVAAIGLAALTGWATGMTVLTSVRAQWVAMPPATAICLVLAGLALVAASKSRTNRYWQRTQIAASSLVFAVAFFTLIQDALGLNLGMDQLLHSGPAPLDQRQLTGTMPLATATTFLLTAAAVIMLDTLACRLSQLFALFAMGIATLALLGYAYGVSALHDAGFFSTVALPAAVAAMLLGVGILLIRPAHGVVAVLVSRTVGGVLARRLLPLAFATPFLLGWLRIEGERRGLYDSSFGVALTSIAYVVIFALSAWRTAEAFRRSDDSRLDAEQVLRASQVQISGLVESAMDAIVMLDDAQRIIVFNPAAEKMFGYARADIVGSSLNKLLPDRFRAAHDAHLQAFAVSGSASRRMGSLGAVAAIRADGTEFPAEASISHFNLGQGGCYTAIVRDITERTRAEGDLLASEKRERERAQELRNLLYAVPAAVCIAQDHLLSNITKNHLYDDWFGGGDRPDDRLDRPTDAGSRVRSGPEALRQAADGTEIRDYEFSHVDANGNVRYLFGNAMPLRDQAGSTYGAISAFVDVTALKLSEQAMLSVTAASVAKSDYITHMTHELRTPLNTMLGHAQMLERGATTAAQIVGINQICKAGWYLRDLISEVQDLAIIEAESAGKSREAVSMDDLLQDMRAMIAPLVSGAGLHLCLTGTDGLDVSANRLRIKQVMLNLLSNAIKYNRPGGSIEVSRVMDGDGRVLVGVRDGGHGLAPMEVASLFRPFNRLGQEHGKEVGTGVGLVVTRKLVESMGGTIGVESEVGRGSFFWFKMPAAGAPQPSVVQ